MKQGGRRLWELSKTLEDGRMAARKKGWAFIGPIGRLGKVTPPFTLVQTVRGSSRGHAGRTGGRPGGELAVDRVNWSLNGSFKG